MFNFKKTKTEENIKTVTLKLAGLHCTSCAVNIDLTLEDIPGIKNADTNFAKLKSVVSYDPSQTDIDSIKEAIHNLGYIVS